MNGHDLKQLQTRKAKIVAEIASLDVARRDAQKSHQDALNKLRLIEQEINSFAISKDPVVSEHALLRYIEREMGFDLDVIKDAILTNERKVMIKAMGNGKYPIGKCKAVVKDMVIISIVD